MLDAQVGAPRGAGFLATNANTIARGMKTACGAENRRTSMQTTIQPELVRATAICASCGTSYEIRSTKPAFRLDVCAACHPAYTGVERTAATGSRIERFERKWRR
jgi:large subunit ribosomal protein L31